MRYRADHDMKSLGRKAGMQNGLRAPSAVSPTLLYILDAPQRQAFRPWSMGRCLNDYPANPVE